LSDAQHLARFQDCAAYAAAVAPLSLGPARADRFLAGLADLGQLADARSLIGWLVV
jgi:hypothetical protein